MNKQYRELLATCALNAAIVGENAVEAEEKQNPEKDNSASIEMIEEFRDMHARLVHGEDLEVSDYAKLWVGTTVAVRTLQKNINTWTAVVKEYQDKVLPHLYEIAMTEDKEKAYGLIKEYFGE